MKNRDYYRIEDFLEDASFVAWVQETNSKAIPFWNKWQKEHPEQAELLELAVAIVKGIKFAPEYVNTAKVRNEWDKLNQRIDEKEQLNVEPIRIMRPWFSRRPSLRMVAGIAFLFVIAFLVQQYIGSGQVSHYAGFGKRLEIDLPDGTHLTLNANSTLCYEKENPRKVWLDGEAFFKVAKKIGADKKFRVITSDLTVEVYGTEFNVNSRKKQTQVVLEEGKVQLALSNGTLKELEPGDLITYSADLNQIIEEKRLGRVETLTSWKDGTLIFDDISLRDAMEKISELYGLEVVFEEAETADELIHLAVPTDNIEICILAIERSGSIRIKLENNLLKVTRLVN